MDLDELIKEYLIEIGDSNFNRYARTMQFAVSGLRALNMDVSGAPKMVELDITDRDTVTLPKDFINYVKIGLIRGGEVVSLGLNDNKSFIQNVDDCGTPESTHRTEQNNDGLYFVGWDGMVDNFRNGECVGRFFGMGGGDSPYGTYRIDLNKGEIVLGGVGLIDKIVLEYIGDVTEIDGHFQVHPFIIDTLKAWIFWRSSQRNSSKGLGERQMAEQDYWKEYRRTRRRFSSRSYDEWIAAIRKGNKLAPRN